MLNMEKEAAEHAMRTRTYVTWRSVTGADCTRIGPRSRCFCGHTYAQHRINVKKNSFACGCSSTKSKRKCACKRFEYVPQRCEEVGEWWLPRRKDFKARDWIVKCKCKHSHLQHRADYSKTCKVCSCSGFNSSCLCLICDKHTEEHETTWETEAERKLSGKPTGALYVPLSELPQVSKLVFAPSARAKANNALLNKKRPSGAPMARVRNSGGGGMSSAAASAMSAATAAFGSGGGGGDAKQQQQLQRRSGGPRAVNLTQLKQKQQKQQQQQQQQQQQMQQQMQW
jgi:hypothetical protein